MSTQALSEKIICPQFGNIPRHRKPITTEARKRFNESSWRTDIRTAIMNGDWDKTNWLATNYAAIVSA